MKISKKNKKLVYKIVLLILVLILGMYKDQINNFLNKFSFFGKSYALSDVPEYSGDRYVIINNNEPNFDLEDYNTNSFESYSNLDILGRCGIAFANIGTDLMPTEKRESIGNVRPSGWQFSKYDFIDGKYLYNRCHLIAFQLTGENANPKNLITCTRTTNAKTMLEFENKVANYIKKTNNHVLYRVTPIFKGTDLVASGIEMEAESVEDSGAGIKFHVYIYNVEDGVEIDYQDGSNKLKK